MDSLSEFSKYLCKKNVFLWKQHMDINITFIQGSENIQGQTKLGSKKKYNEDSNKWIMFIT